VLVLECLVNALQNTLAKKSFVDLKAIHAASKRASNEIIGAMDNLAQRLFNANAELSSSATPTISPVDYQDSIRGSRSIQAATCLAELPTESERSRDQKGKSVETVERKSSALVLRLGKSGPRRQTSSGMIKTQLHTARPSANEYRTETFDS